MVHVRNTSRKILYIPRYVMKVSLPVVVVVKMERNRTHRQGYHLPSWKWDPYYALSFESIQAFKHDIPIIIELLAAFAVHPIHMFEPAHGL